jgi:hypothetical protein
MPPALELPAFAATGARAEEGAAGGDAAGHRRVKLKKKRSDVKLSWRAFLLGRWGVEFGKVMKMAGGRH